MNVDLQNRGQRLDRILNELPLSHNSLLVKAIALTPRCINQLKTVAAVHVWHSLVKAYPERNFVFSPCVLEDYEADVLALPNRTPNGLLLPRRETFLSFNMVQQALAGMVEELQLCKFFESFQSPCNLRIISGTASPSSDNRPYASSKIHTDVWYGEPLRSILFNLPLLGNTAAAELVFFEPDTFPTQYRIPLADYDEGRKVQERAKRLPMSFDLGALYLSDALSLHQTVCREPGIRLSLDWRGMPQEKLWNEPEGAILSRATYVETERFLKGGSSIVFADGDPLDAHLRRSRGEIVDPTTITIDPIGTT